MTVKSKSAAGKAKAPAKAKVAPEVVVPAPAPVAIAEPEVVEAAPVVETPVAEVIEAAPVVEAAPEPVAAEPTPEVAITPTTTPAPTKKDKPMTTTVDFSAFQNTLSDVQAKAKEAYEKGTAAFGDYNSFAKGNVEALVEAGKILSAGLQELSGEIVAESRTAFEALTAEVKELAAAKTPTEFLRLQSELAKKHLDHAVSFGSKQSEAVMKLTTEATAPLTSRVTLAVEKLQKNA